MPRPRKFDYKKNYPIKLFIKVPVEIINELEQLGYKQNQIEKLIEDEKIVEKYLRNFVEKIGKKVE